MLAVVGNPVYHSLSPELFRLWGEDYTRIAAVNDNDILIIAFEHNLSGINITSPFKKSMAIYLQFLSAPHPSPLPEGEGEIWSKSDSQTPIWKTISESTEIIKKQSNIRLNIRSYFSAPHPSPLPEGEGEIWSKSDSQTPFRSDSQTPFRSDSQTPIWESKIKKTADTINKQNLTINTLVFSEKEILGFNTDYDAVKQFLNDYRNTNLFLIGAGDVADTILSACNECKINVSVYNRTQSKLDILANDYSFTVISKRNLTEAIIHSDIIFNISPDWENEIYNAIKNHKKKNQIFADAIYNNSPFKKLNIKVAFSGIDWLISQGKKAYEKFKSTHAHDSVLYENIEENLIRKKTDNIILTGFMGAGKTTIGKLLAKKLDFNFIDTDYLIEQKANLSINEIFSNYSEDYFRKIETEIINELDVKNHIIATGGGALLRNSEKLKSLGEFIYLYSDFYTCIERIKNSDRPLIERNNIQKLYNERKMLYITNSDLVINSGTDKENVAERLFREIDYAFGN